MMPEWVEAILRNKTYIEPGERHKTCYRIGAVWQLLGWDFGHLINLAEQTRLTEIGLEDMHRALSNGFKANEHYNVILMDRRA